MSDSRFYSLDVFRGLAALSVTAGHFIIEGTYPIDGRIPQAEQVSILWNFSFIYAVDFFLVLSGFVLAHSYLHKMDISFRDFALRRFFRMYPLHLLTLVATLCIFIVFGFGIAPYDVALHALFIHNLGIGPAGVAFNAPAWTISVEFWINVSVFLALLKAKRDNALTWVGFVAVALTCFALVAWGTGHLNVNSEDYKRVLNSGLLRCLGSFIVGMLVYEIYRKTRGWSPHIWMVAASLVVFLATIMILPGHSLLGFLTPPIFALIILVVASAEKATLKYFRPLVFLGDVSFSVYLVHHPIIRLFRETGIEKSVLAGLVYLVVVYFLAALSFRYFERPVYRTALRKTAPYRLQ